LKDCIFPALSLVFRGLPLAIIGALIASFLQALWFTIGREGLTGFIGNYFSFSVAFSFWYSVIIVIYLGGDIRFPTLIRTVFPKTFGKVFVVFMAIVFFGIILYHLATFVLVGIIMAFHAAMETFSWYAAFASSSYGWYVGSFLMLVIGILAALICIVIYFVSVFYMVAISGWSIDESVEPLAAITPDEVRSYKLNYDFVEDYRYGLLEKNETRRLFLIVIHTAILLSVSALIALIVYGNIIMRDDNLLMSDGSISNVGAGFAMFMFSFLFFSTSFLFFHLFFDSKIVINKEADSYNSE